MSDRVDRSFVLTSIVLSFVISATLIRNFEYYWLYVALAGTSTASVAIFLRWFWIELKPKFKSYFSFVTILLCFWLVVWFWYVDDFLPDYWTLVFVNSLSCALLSSILHWQRMWEVVWLPYVVCLLIALGAMSVAFAIVIQIPKYSGDDFLRFFFVPVETVAFTGVLALIWWIFLRRPIHWWHARRSKAKPQQRPLSGAQSVDHAGNAAPDAGKIRSAAAGQSGPIAAPKVLFDGAGETQGRVIVVCPRSHKLRVPMGKRGEIQCPLCKRDGINTVFRATT